MGGNDVGFLLFPAKSSQHTEPLLPNLRCENIVSVL